MIFKGEQVIRVENHPVRGFQSSVPPRLFAGLGNMDDVDSMILIWPDHRFEVLDKGFINAHTSINWREDLPFWKFNHEIDDRANEPLDVTAASGLNFVHKENKFIEFLREPLIPFMTSSEGPALAQGDVNGDGLDDIFFGSGKHQPSELHIQEKSGNFQKVEIELFEKDKTFEDVDALFVDIENDGDLDLVVASGGNEFYGESEYLLQRIYINNGSGLFNERMLLDSAFFTAGCVAAGDFDNDGFTDLFFGARAEPNSYGVKPQSYLFKNSEGKFVDVTADFAKGLRNIGLVKDATWVDIDSDNDLDLLLVSEWDNPKIARNNSGRFEIIDLSNLKGLWNFVYPGDFDQDGDIDFIAGNMGKNTKLKASTELPLTMYVNDFDDNGKVEQLLTYYVEGEETLFANHMEITKQMVKLKKDFLYAKDFAKAKPKDLVGEQAMRNAEKFSINTNAHYLFLNINPSEIEFEALELPQRAQFSTQRVAQTIQVTEDTTQIFLGGNFWDNAIEAGWYGADYGNILKVARDGNMVIEPFIRGGITGQVRKAGIIEWNQGISLILTRNNDSALMYRLSERINKATSLNLSVE
jgi:hypothetical protein